MAVEWWKQQPRKRPRVVEAGSRFVECPGCSRHVFAALLNQHLDSGCASATAAPPARSDELNQNSGSGCASATAAPPTSSEELNRHLDSGRASATAAPPASSDELPARAETGKPAADADLGGLCDVAVGDQGAKHSDEAPRGDHVGKGSTAHEDALDALGHELTCAICTDPYENPHLLPCGHKFCLDCVLGAFRQRHECPICRLPAQKRSLVKDTTIAAIVDVWRRARQGRRRLRLRLR